jgi:hypothetical protein
VDVVRVSTPEKTVNHVIRIRKADIDSTGSLRSSVSGGQTEELNKTALPLIHQKSKFSAIPFAAAITQKRPPRLIITEEDKGLDLKKPKQTHEHA